MEKTDRVTDNADEVQRETSASPVDDFEAAFGESLDDVLDLERWVTAYDLPDLYRQLEEAVARAVEEESDTIREIRRVVFPQLRTRPNAPAQAGVFQATDGHIARVHRQLLFNGAVEACDGNSLTDDRLPLTVTQIGISLVAYNGSQNTWVQRLFRRDLRQRSADPVADALSLLESRHRRGGIGVEDEREELSELARRGLMAYAERALLLTKSDRPWRMGHGNPVPYEILTGSGNMRLLEAGLAVLDRLIGEHQRFVFVPSTTSMRGRLFPTLGNALRPLEYAVVDSLRESLLRIVENGHYGERYKRLALDFVHRHGDSVLVGVYRASELAPAQMFFAHQDHVHTAALIAMADSVLQAHRGFPMLIDLADTSCRSMMGMDGFGPSVETAYIKANAPYRYLNERSTRHR